MKLNLGSGSHPVDGWVNLDYRPEPVPGCKADMAGDLMRLPFADGCATSVYLGHVLEHLDYVEEVPAALAEVRRVLADGGEVICVGPAVDLFADLAGRGDPAAPPWLLKAICDMQGPGDGPGAKHRWVPTVSMVLDAFRRAGFTAWSLDIDLSRPPRGANTEFARWQHCVVAVTY